MTDWTDALPVAVGAAGPILTLMLTRRWSTSDRAKDATRQDHEYWRNQRLQVLSDLVDVGNRAFILGVEMSLRQKLADDDEEIYLRSNQLLTELGTATARAQLVTEPGTALAAAVDEFFAAVNELGRKGGPDWEAQRLTYIVARDALRSAFVGSSKLNLNS